MSSWSFASRRPASTPQRSSGADPDRWRACCAPTVPACSSRCTGSATQTVVNSKFIRHRNLHCCREGFSSGMAVGELEVLQCDLASFTQIRAFAANLQVTVRDMSVGLRAIVAVVRSLAIHTEQQIYCVCSMSSIQVYPQRCSHTGTQPEHRLPGAQCGGQGDPKVVHQGGP